MAAAHRIAFLSLFGACIVACGSLLSSGDDDDDDDNPTTPNPSMNGGASDGGLLEDGGVLGLVDSTLQPDVLNVVDTFGPPFGTKIVFLSVEKFSVPGPIGGKFNRDAADELCKKEAASVPAMNGKTFLAWMSSGSSGALDRLVTDNAWTLSDGTPVFANKLAIQQSGWKTPIQMSADKTILDVSAEGEEWAWTGTSYNGGPTMLDCGGWQSQSGSGGTAGKIDATKDQSEKWTYGMTLSCDTAHRVYCFEL